MGEVYRAHDSRLSRDVAIKIIPELVSSDPERQQRFDTEAKAAAALNHPNILAVYQMGTYAGIPYIVSELLEGVPLSEVLRRGPLPLRKALDYGVQIAHGLAAAHDKGIVHRDLKPDNLFVTKDGRIKILDFGLAKLTQTKEAAKSLAPTVTLPGVAVGTVGYMSPEQVRGLETDQRTDIFALGAILYEMVMGQRAFHKSTEADTISAILNEEPAPIPQLAPDTPAALERLIRRCMEKNAAQRFHSASDLAFALEALCEAGTSTPSGSFRIESSHAIRRSSRWSAGLAIAACILVAIGYFAFRSVPPPKLANYRQLTHDGQPKSLIGTDGSRLYLTLGVDVTGTLSTHGIAEMAVSGGDVTKIPAATSSGTIPMDLSPDGSSILVVDGTGSPPIGPLRTVPTLGGPPRRIGDLVGETASWSPDGRFVAYTELGELFVANADGTGSHKLLSMKGEIRNVAWSPDGKRLRFDSAVTGATLEQQTLWEVRQDGTNLHQLVPGWNSGANVCCGRWTTDGKFYVFESGSQIWALPQKRLFHSDPMPVQLTTSPMALSSPLPSRDGKKLFLIGQTYRGELTEYDSKTGQFTPYLGGISAEYADFSKDGQWIAYVSYRDGILWRSKMDGSERVPLTSPPMYPVLPRWSPDGKSIIFFEFGRTSDQPARMYKISADGGMAQLLLPHDAAQQLDPNWSPDGTRIIFGGESNDPSTSIRVLELATNRVSTLPESQGLYSPRWSPDGRYICAFSADSTKVLLFDVSTQKWTDVVTDNLGWLSWSHDGQYIYALQYGGKDDVIRIRVRDGKVETVASLKNLVTTGRYGGDLSLTPNDNPLLLKDTGSQDVYSVDWQSQ